MFTHRNYISAFINVIIVDSCHIIIIIISTCSLQMLLNVKLIRTNHHSMNSKSWINWTNRLQRTHFLLWREIVRGMTTIFIWYCVKIDGSVSSDINNKWRVHFWYSECYHMHAHYHPLFFRLVRAQHCVQFILVYVNEFNSSMILNRKFLILRKRK